VDVVHDARDACKSLAVVCAEMVGERVDERPGEVVAEVPNAGEPLTPPEGSTTTVAAVLRQRIVDRYQGDHAWYLLNRFLPLVEHFGHLESHNAGRYHSFQWAVILTSPITAFAMDSAIGQYTGLSDNEKLAQLKTNCESTVHGINTDWAALQTPPQADKAAG